jgi:hypothetical protein
VYTRSENILKSFVGELNDQYIFDIKSEIQSINFKWSRSNPSIHDLQKMELVDKTRYLEYTPLKTNSPNQNITIYYKKIRKTRKTSNPILPKASSIRSIRALDI